jgi:periplasmic protein TonB
VTLAHQARADGGPETASRALRWTAAAALVVAAHGGMVWLAVNWRAAEPAPGEPPPAVMIELSPVAVSPKAPLQDVAPGPPSAESAPPPADNPVAELKPDEPAKPVETIKPDPTPTQPQAAKAIEEPQPDLPPLPQPVAATPPAHPSPTSASETPDLPQVDKAEAVLAPPPAKTIADPTPPPPRQAAVVDPPKAAAVVAPPPKPKPAKPPTEAKKLEPRRADHVKPLKPGDQLESRRTSAPPTSTARQAETAAAPSSSASLAPSVSAASWKGELLAHLNRYKRYPAGATGVGTVSVAFAIDRSGVVTSARLVASCGDSALDEEAVALLRRASPVPPPPPGIGHGAAIALTVPIRFDRQ